MAQVGTLCCIGYVYTVYTLLSIPIRCVVLPGFTARSISQVAGHVSWHNVLGSCGTVDLAASLVRKVPGNDEG